MIVLYHKVARLQHDYNSLGVTPKNFRYQIEYINNHYDIVPLNQAREDAVTITFDDGFRDFYTEVYPYLSQNDIPATIFIATAKIGSKEELWTSELLRLIFSGNDSRLFCRLKMPMFSYDFTTQSLEEKITLYHAVRRLCMKSEEAVLQSILLQLREWAGMDSIGREEYCFLTEEEIRILANNPLVTLGAHTCSHISLGAFPKAYQEQEIIRSKEELERITGKEILYFSYPFGQQYDYNEETIEILKHSGFTKAYTTRLQIGRNRTYEIPRAAMPNLGGKEFDIWFEELMQGRAGCMCRHRQEKPVAYIGKLKADKILLQESRKIAVFGAGRKGEKIYQELKAYGKEKDILCFIDNNKEKQGKYLEEKQIIPVERLQELKPEIILVNSIWEKEIIEQLICAGVDGIHWIVD